MCRRTALETGREALLSEWQEANCQDRRLLPYSRLAGKLGELAMDQPFVVLSALIGRLGNSGNSGALHLAGITNCYYNPRRGSDLCPLS
jgi:hypothetical protein